MIKKTAFVTLFLILSIAILRSADKSPFRDPHLIRIGLIPKTKRVKLELKGATRFVDETNNKIYKVIKSVTTYIYSKNSKTLSIGPFTFGSTIRLVPLDGGDKLKINGNSYRGNIYLKSNGGRHFTVIEELQLEDYLCGVLPLEMGPKWPLEALKAQAVVARTYALYNRKKYYNQGYDLSNDIRSQVYGGKKHQNGRVLKAVKKTKGEVLTYKGKLIETLYHANCGGKTSPPIWGAKAIKPLSGRKCRYCGYSHNHEWSQEVSKSNLLKFLKTKGHNANKIKSIKPDYKNSAGRVLRLKFRTDRGTIKVKTGSLRRYIGYNKLKSHYITQIVSTGKSFKFSGQGFGHGVGMCQDGVKAMAKGSKNFKPKGYKEILQYYYPGAKIGALQYN